MLCGLKICQIFQIPQLLEFNLHNYCMTGVTHPKRVIESLNLKESFQDKIES